MPERFMDIIWPGLTVPKVALTVDPTAVGAEHERT